MATALDQLRQRFSPAWIGWAELRGRLTELSAPHGAGLLTWAMGWVYEAQAAGELVAWLTHGERHFYPPDASSNGIDLAALAVIRVPDGLGVSRSAERLARSGAFGLIVLDLGPRATIPDALQSRLAQHALPSETAILCLAEKPDAAASLSSLVSLRGLTRCQHQGEDAFVCQLTISKDKRRGPGRERKEVCHGPPGLR